MYHKLLTATLTAVLIFGTLSLAEAAKAKPIQEGQFLSAKECGKCHAEIYGMWKDSMHSQAISDPIFKTAFMEAYMKSRGTAKKACLNCHSPTTMFTGDMAMQKPITSEGVTCHFCHSVEAVSTKSHLPVTSRFRVRPGKTIRTPGPDGSTKYHTQKHSELHRSSTLCSGCHEYSANGIKIMGTYSEWLNSDYSRKGIQCQTCHMPKRSVGEGRRAKKAYSHYLAGGHSISQLKRAVKVEILGITRKKNKIIVELQLENSGSGHSVPTGIPSRKLILTCKVTSGNRSKSKKIKYEKIIFDANGKELVSDSDIMLGRGAKIAKDNRLAAGEKRKQRLIFYMKPKGEIFVSATVEYLYRPKIVQDAEMKIEMNRAEKSFQ